MKQMKTVALLLFVCTYALLLALPKWRSHVAVASAALFVALGIVPLSGLAQAIDWNVIMMIAGTMGTVWFFILSGMPALLADRILRRVRTVQWATVSLAFFSGLISALMDNVATVLIVAPVALEIARKLKTSPVPIVISIAVFSNLQGMATLVGDTTSILLGGYAGMNFLDFFVLDGKMGLFFVVQLATLAATGVLIFNLRHCQQSVEVGQPPQVTEYFPTLLLSAKVVLLTIVSFLPDMPEMTNGLICMALFGVGLIWAIFIRKKKGVLKDAFREMDWPTLFLLGGLFVVIDGITRAGLVDEISQWFARVGGDNVFLIYTLLVWFSVLFSAFIDNIPYVATMLPVASGIAQIMGVDAFLLYFGIMVGATLGGNLTPIGASANITGIGLLRKEGYTVRTVDFLRIGVPSTLTAVVIGYVLIWLIYG